VCALIAAALISLISMTPHAQHTGDKLQIARRNSPLVCSYNERAAGSYQLIDEPSLMMIVSVGGERVIDTSYYIQTHTFISPRIFFYLFPIYKKCVEAFNSARLRRSFIGKQSESERVKGLPPDFIAFSLLYLNRKGSLPFAQQNQPRMLGYVYSWYSADVFYHKGHHEPCSIFVKPSWLIADVNGDLYPGSMARDQYSPRDISAVSCGICGTSGGVQASPHDARLSPIDADLPDDRAKLQKPHGNQQPISKLHFRIVGLIFSITAYWIAFCGAWLDWRRRWHGIGLIVLGSIVFCCGVGAIVITAYYP
jgi:hypothetical protein